MKRMIGAAVAAVVCALAASASAEAAPCKVAAADSVVMQMGAACTNLLFAPAQMRTAARALGYGGVAQYAVLPGKGATLRVPSGSTPTFYATVPANMQAQGVFTLASLQPRKNNTREVMIGGGYMSISSGIHPDRVIASTATRAASQAGAPAGTAIYELKPNAPLAGGEYAIVVASGAAGGVAATGIPGLARYYDFGVD
jgi:hypothetical protein